MLRASLTGCEDGIKYYFRGLDWECVRRAVELIQADPVLKPKVEIHLSRKVFGPLGVDPSLLADQAVGDFRNDEHQEGKKIMLLGPPDESEWDTLRYMKPFGEEQLMEADEVWVDEFAPSHFDKIRKTWWCAALRGLNSLACIRLDEFAAFAVRTSEVLSPGSKELPEALGASLPTLKMPAHSGLFSIPEKARGQASQWKRKFNDHRQKAQCFLFKKDRNETYIDNASLVKALQEYEAQPDHAVDVIPVLRAFVEADYGWSPASEDLAEVEWTVSNPILFDRVTPKRAQNLGQDTLDLFDREQKLNDLNDDERAYLRQLKESGPKSEPAGEDKNFFRRHYRDLHHDPSLFSRWESYILDKTIEDTDFIHGLTRCLRQLRPKEGNKPWRIVVRPKAHQKKDLVQINEDTGVYFATRYGGIQGLVSDSIEFSGFDSLLNYPNLLPDLKNVKGYKLKTAKAACQLVFYVELKAGNKKEQVRLIWKFNPDSLAANLRNDMTRLQQAKNPIVSNSVWRETSGRRALPLDLSNIACLQPAHGRTSGSLIPAVDKLKDYALRAELGSILDRAVSAGQIDQARRDCILDVYSAFEAKYREALTQFLSNGLLAHQAVGDAADAYGSMLQNASAPELPDILLGDLIPVLLKACVISVQGLGHNQRPAVIIPPWHPLRLLAITSKALQFAELARRFTTGSIKLSDLDGDLFFADTAEWLNHVFYPEVTILKRGVQPTLLSVCQHLQEYSVHESPLRQRDGDVPTDSDPRAAASHIGTIVESYLELQPHERDNLSVVLFDCDSELLPGSVVEKIKDLSEDEDQDAVCQVLLAHSDKSKLRALYRSLCKSAETPDAPNSSEATRDFMARLRINIMVADNGKNTGRRQHPYDIVFAENTISRHAKEAWDDVKIDAAPSAEVNPASWSRRKPMTSGAITSSIYLTSPASPLPVWQHIRAIAFAIDPEAARQTPENMCRVPMLSLGVNDETVGQLLDSMHNLGSWVVNYDELLHRKLLEQKGIRIIRYKQSATQGKNLIISSRAKDGMLRAELRKISIKLLPDLDSDQLRDLVDRLITEANSISGNLVLRAIRRSENAKELMGLVLSKYLLQNEVGSDHYFGWFLLDDYATWLGEEEQQIADILCLSPATDDEGKCVLDIIVTEVKFVESLSVSKKAKESENQLKQTLSRLESGFRKDNTSLDAGIWRARISDMIVDGIDTPAVAKFDAAEWRRKVRSGGCTMRLRGYSHVFDSGPEQTSYDEPQAIKDTDNGFQEKFSLHQTSAVLRAFFSRLEPARTPPVSPKSKPTAQERGSAGFPFPYVDVPPLPPKPHPSPKSQPDEGSHQESAPEPGVASLGDMIEGGDPLIALLNASADSAREDESTDAWVESTTVATRRALTSYGMPCELAAQPILTPNSLLLCFKGSDKLTAGSLEKKRSELLTTHGLKVVTVRAAAGAVRIYLERPHRQVVPLARVWKSWIPTVGDSGNTNLLIAVKEEDSSPVYLNPIKQSPHTLIAGTSGSGKSVLMQSLLLGIMATNTPSKAKIILIDPKQGSDYGPLRNMPHIGNIITDMESALVELTALVSEMNRRYQLMAQFNVNHIDLYNQEAPEKLPYLWLVHDEFALWMQHKQYREQVLSLGNQLAIMARAAGIFLIFAAQRPSVDVMPMQMRDNLDNRLILRVAQDGTSEFCLGEAGAEKLLMKGQMLARLGGEEPILCQVPYASIAELKAICDALILRYS